MKNNQHARRIQLLLQVFSGFSGSMPTLTAYGAGPVCVRRELLPFFSTCWKWTGCCLTLVLLLGCGEPQISAPEEVAPGLAEYVAAFTSGEVSKADDISVVFGKPVIPADRIGEAVDDSWVSFTPEIAGRAVWKDRSTLVLKLETWLHPGTTYVGTLHLDRVFKDFPPRQESQFRFQFHTLRREFDIRIDPLRAAESGSLQWQELNGAILSSDRESQDDVASMLQATQEGVHLKVTVDSSPDGRVHAFKVAGIERRKQASQAILTWDGSHLDAAFSGKKALDIPPLNQFIFLSATLLDSGDPTLRLDFSDPLKTDQDLVGLVHIPGHEVTLTVEGNSIKVHPRGPLSGEVTVRIEKGIQNVLGFRLPQASQATVTVEEPKPELRLAGNGVIVPGSMGVLFPFEAVNLRAVDIRVVKIFSENMHQFFQVNQLNGADELYRVGQTVLQKRIDLDPGGSMDLKAWNRHVIDLASLVKTDVGSLYRVTLGFRKSYSLYNCPDAGEDESEEAAVFQALEEDQESFWDYYENAPYYSYRHRQDPCHVAYYNSDRSVSRNVLASDLGLTAQTGSDGEMMIAVTHLGTTNAVAHAAVQVFDFQQQELATATTNGDGLAAVSGVESPFFIVAKSGQQRGYLSLRDGEALSLSRFDVGGSRGDKGLRAFMYGERGVWRPGDTIHLTAMVEDRNQKLPPRHPVALEVSDPRGRICFNQTQFLNDHGLAVFSVPTQSDDPTGNYQARLNVGGARFERRLKVETVMPNRLKINLDVPGDAILAFADRPQASLDVTWLHGAIARDLAATVEMRLVSRRTQFNTHDDYVFDDPGRRFDSDPQVLFDGRIDDQGHASFPVNAEVNDSAPGALEAQFACKVFEPGGAFSVDAFAKPFHPYEVYVGLKFPPGDKERGMLLTDESHPVGVVTLNHEGRPVARKNIQIALYKLDWKWWWDQGASRVTSYNTAQLSTPLATGVLETDDKGQAEWHFQINYPDWGRYFVRVVDPDGHSSGRVVYVDWPGWAGRPQGDQPGGAAMLTFSADKTRYQVGEEVTLSIPTGAEGRALMVMEYGGRIGNAQWIQAVQGTTYARFQATAEMAPNVHVWVSLLQPHAQTMNDLPIRLYGVLPIDVEDPSTRISPRIAMPDVLQPDQHFSITVSEASGRAMSYTLAVVDEGLLDLTRFRTPDPWSHFYSRQALMVKTFDNFNQVLGALGGPMGSLLSLGGGAGDLPKQPPKANRFVPVVRFLGPFVLPDHQSQSHEIQMPTYVGSVRTMVVASSGAAFGFAEKTSPVRKPLMLLGTLPRVLGPGESLDAPLTVFAMESEIRDVNLSIETSELLQADETTRRITFADPGDQVVRFPLQVAENTGIATFRATARCGKELATHSIELDVRNPNPVSRDIISAEVPPGQVWQTTVKSHGMPGTRKNTLEISAVPPMNLSARLDALIQYPHGCLEQLTSQLFPQLYLQALVEIPKAQQSLVEKNLAQGIQRMAQFQTADGGFAVWPGLRQSHEWITNFAGHFLLEARRAGYAIPDSMFQAWMAFQRLKANAWVEAAGDPGLVQSYRLLLLAAAEGPQLGPMNRMREMRLEDHRTSWLLASAYALAGQDDVAQSLCRGLDEHGIPDSGHHYGSVTRDQALILYCAHILQKNETVKRLTAGLSHTLCSEQYLNTHAVGFALMAISQPFAQAKSELHVRYRVDRDPWQSMDAKHPLLQQPLPDRDQFVVEIENPSKAPLYVRCVRSGRPLAGEETAAARHLKIDVTYADRAGTPLDPSLIHQGADFTVTVRIQHAGDAPDLKDLALTQIFPSGWEILSARREQGDAPQGLVYQDVRDDRVLSYFNLRQGDTIVLTSTLNASYAGRFYLPATSVESMYIDDVYARIPGGWTVVQP